MEDEEAVIIKNEKHNHKHLTGERIYLKLPLAEIEISSDKKSIAEIINMAGEFLLWYRDNFGNSKARSYTG